MMMNKKQRVLGYSRQEVDSYMQQLADQQQSEVLALRTRLAEVNEQVIRWQQEKQELEKEKQRRSQEQKLLLLATEQLEQARQALLRAMQQQADDERRALQVRLAEAEQQCLELDRQMEGLQQQIDTMLTRCAALTGEEEILRRKCAQASVASPGAVSNSHHRPAVLADIQTRRPEQSSFWDTDLDIVLGQAQPHATQSADAVAMQPSPATETPSSEESTPAEETSSPPLAGETTQQHASEPVADSVADAAPVPPQFQASPAVAEDVRQLRYRYMVGKVAGEELRDDQGALIVAQGGAITQEVVMMAESAGKLPQLIINMQLPGMAGR